MVQPDRPRKTIWGMHIACWLPQATNAYSEYVIPTSFPHQQGLHECSSVLRYMHIACLVQLYLQLKVCTIANLLTYLLTYLLHGTESFFEKLTAMQLVKEFPAFHGTRRFITALTSVRHLSLSWASPIQSIYPHHTSWRYVLILSAHLRQGLPSGLFPSGFPTKTLYTPYYY